jgi:hypothetical protein
MDVNFTPSPDIDQEILGHMFPTNGHHSGGDSVIVIVVMPVMVTMVAVAITVVAC